MPHVYELEASNVLQPCERHEAEGYTIYPSQMEYKLKLDQATGELTKEKLRGCLGGHRWRGDEVRYWGNASHLEIKLMAETAVRAMMLNRRRILDL